MSGYSSAPARCSSCPSVVEPPLRDGLCPDCWAHRNRGDSFLPTMALCECTHRKALHWYGEGKCGWYDGNALAFENGKPKKSGQCPCLQFRRSKSVRQT